MSPVLKPVQSPPARIPLITSGVNPILSPATLSPKSPTSARNHAIPLPSASHAVHTTTAEDLLKDVMMGVNKSSEPAAPFMQSIWSASSDEQSLRFAAGSSPPKNTYQSPRQYQHDLPQTWTSSFSSGGSHLVQNSVIGASQTTQSQLSMGSGLNSQYGHQRLPSLSSTTYQTYPAFNQTESRDPPVYPRLAQQQISTSSQAPTDHHYPSFSPPQTMSSSAFSNVIGTPVTSVAAAFGNPLATVPTSPRFNSGGANTSLHNHVRQMSLGQTHHSPHHSHSHRPPVPGQPFASMPQAW